MMSSSTDLYYFLELSKTLNISRAAERLAITQPTLTQSLKRLEYAVGNELFIRSKAGLIITRAGKKLIPRVESLINDWESLKSDLNEEEISKRGHFRMGCHPAVAHYTLPSLYAFISKNSPEIELSHRFDLSRNITELVVSYQLDFGLVINPFPHPDLVIKKILTDHVYIWEAKKRNHDHLFADLSLTQSQTLLKKSQKGLNFSKIISIPDLFVIESLVDSGAGFGILPERVISEKSRKNFIPFKKDLFHFEDTLALVYRKEMMKSTTAQYLITSIKDIF